MAARNGRPTRYTNALADRICSELRQGKSLKLICDDPSMPGTTTVYRWLSLPSRQDFRDRYARAREDSADAMLEDILDIADTGDNDTYVDDNGNVRTDNDVVQRSKLRIETRKWAMARLKPTKYGDKIDVTSGDKPLEQPLYVFDMRPADIKKPRDKEK